MHNRLLLSALVAASSTAAVNIPSNVQNFYDSVKAKGTCSNKLATGFYAKDNGPNSEISSLPTHQACQLTFSQPFRTAETTFPTTM